MTDVRYQLLIKLHVSECSQILFISSVEGSPDEIGIFQDLAMVALGLVGAVKVHFNINAFVNVIAKYPQLSPDYM